MSDDGDRSKIAFVSIFYVGSPVPIGGWTPWLGLKSGHRTPLLGALSLFGGRALSACSRGALWVSFFCETADLAYLQADG